MYTTFLLLLLYTNILFSAFNCYIHFYSAFKGNIWSPLYLSYLFSAFFLLFFFACMYRHKTRLLINKSYPCHFFFFFFPFVVPYTHTLTEKKAIVPFRFPFYLLSGISAKYWRKIITTLINTLLNVEEGGMYVATWCLVKNCRSFFIYSYYKRSFLFISSKYITRHRPPSRLLSCLLR